MTGFLAEARGLVLALSLAGPCAGSAAAAEADEAGCPPDTGAAASPSRYIATMKMNEPMPSAMSKQGTTKGHVAQMARQKEACMREALSREQATMKETTDQPKPAD